MLTGAVPLRTIRHYFVTLGEFQSIAPSTNLGVSLDGSI
jgi:hypothetical protein